MSSLPSRRYTAPVLCACLLLALGPPVAQAQEPSGSEPPDDLYARSVEEGLSLAMNRQIGPVEAFPFIQRAARSEDPASISALKALALRYATDEAMSKYQEGIGYNGIAHTAMHALWKKGVPRSYFLDLARQYEQDKWPAFYAATILAVHPDAETLSLIQEMREYFDDAYIDAVHNASMYARGRFEHYEQMASLTEKADFLIKWAGRGFRALGHGNGTVWKDSRHLDPASIRAREELLSFSRQHPSVVARQLAGIEELEYGYSSTREYQEHVGRYLAQASRAELKRLLEERWGSQETGTQQQSSSRQR